MEGMRILDEPVWFVSGEQGGIFVDGRSPLSILFAMSRCKQATACFNGDHGSVHDARKKGSTIQRGSCSPRTQLRIAVSGLPPPPV